MKKILAIFVVMLFSVAVSAFAIENTVRKANGATSRQQTRDPRIGQKEALALINMDPVDPNYRTNYDVHQTGVLLVPSAGPIEGKKGWYKDLAVPAGTLMDFSKSARLEPFTFTAPNGETAEAVRVYLPQGEMAVVNACGNRHPPNEPMIVKMLEMPVITNEVIRDVVREVPVDRPVPYEAPAQRWWCAQGGWRTGVCVAALAAAGYAAFGGGGDDDKECNGCPDRIPRPAP